MTMAYALFLIKASLAKIGDKWDKKKEENKKDQQSYLYHFKAAPLSPIKTYAIEKTMGEKKKTQHESFKITQPLNLEHVKMLTFSNSFLFLSFGTISHR